MQTPGQKGRRNLTSRVYKCHSAHSLCFCCLVLDVASWLPVIGLESESSPGTVKFIPGGDLDACMTAALIFFGLRGLEDRQASRRVALVCASDFMKKIGRRRHVACAAETTRLQCHGVGSYIGSAIPYALHVVFAWSYQREPLVSRNCVHSSGVANGCRTRHSGFVGRWSTPGILVIVVFFFLVFFCLWLPVCLPLYRRTLHFKVCPFWTARPVGDDDVGAG